jgi:hypothetical protein
VRINPSTDGRWIVTANNTALDAERGQADRVDIGHVRPHPRDQFGGVVNGPHSGGSVDINGATPAEAIDHALVVAHEIGWLFPAADGPDEAESYRLTGVEPELPGQRTAT